MCITQESSFRLQASLAGLQLSQLTLAAASEPPGGDGSPSVPYRPSLEAVGSCSAQALLHPLDVGIQTHLAAAGSAGDVSLTADCQLSRLCASASLDQVRELLDPLRELAKQLQQTRRADKAAPPSHVSTSLWLDAGA